MAMLERTIRESKPALLAIQVQYQMDRSSARTANYPKQLWICWIPAQKYSRTYFYFNDKYIKIVMFFA